MIFHENYINVTDWVHSPFATLAREGAKPRYGDDYSVGSLIVGGAIRVISLAAYVPASILDLVSSPFIDLAIFFGFIENLESLEAQNQRLSQEINQSRDTVLATQTENETLANQNDVLNKGIGLLRKAGEEIAAQNRELEAQNKTLAKDNASLTNGSKTWQRVVRDLGRDNQKLKAQNDVFIKAGQLSEKSAEEFKEIEARAQSLQNNNKELEKTLKNESTKLSELESRYKSMVKKQEEPIVESALHVDKNIQSKVIASAGRPSERYTPSDLVVNNRTYTEETEKKHSNLDLDKDWPALEPQLKDEVRDSAYKQTLESLDNGALNQINKFIPKNLKCDGPNTNDYLELPDLEPQTVVTPEAPQATINATTTAKVVTVLTAVSIGAGIYTYYQNQGYIGEDKTINYYSTCLSDLENSLVESVSAVGRFFNEENMNIVKNGAFSFGSSILFGGKTTLFNSFEGAKDVAFSIYNQISSYSRPLTGSSHSTPPKNGAEQDVLFLENASYFLEIANFINNSKDFRPGQPRDAQEILLAMNFFKKLFEKPRSNKVVSDAYKILILAVKSDYATDDIARTITNRLIEKNGVDPAKEIELMKVILNRKNSNLIHTYILDGASYILNNFCSNKNKPSEIGTKITELLQGMIDANRCVDKSERVLREWKNLGLVRKTSTVCQ